MRTAPVYCSPSAVYTPPMASPPEFIVVLCRAEEPGNVGAACRAMASMGLSRLVLADCPDFPAVPVKTFALKAFSLFENAGRFDRLADALSDCALAAGFTRRPGRLRAREPLGVTEFARRAVRRSGRIALVFGNERDGLSGQELSLCDLAVRIPTSEDFPSLNLAQAVQVAAWELSRAGSGIPRDPTRSAGSSGEGMPIARAEIVRTVEAAADDLARAGFFKIAGRPAFVRFLRSLLARAGPAAWELEYLRNLLGKAAALSGRPISEALTPGSGGDRVSSRVPSDDSPEGDGRCEDSKPC